MTKAYRPFAGLAVLAAAMLGVAACGGSSSPHVASLGSSNGNTGATTTTLPKGNPSQLLDEWASCQRSHGDPNQTDPTIDANKVIHITYPPNAGGNGPVSLGAGPGGGPGSGNPCDPYLTAASTDLRGGKPPQRPDPAKLEKYAQCMRANGVPSFPDPSGNGFQIQVGGPNGNSGSDLNPNSATFQNAAKTCAKKTGVQGPGSGGTTAQAGSIEAQSSGGPGGGPGGNGGAGAGLKSSGEVIGG